MFPYNFDFRNLKVGIYARVSDKKQVENGLSLVWQQNILEDFVKKNNLNIVDKYIEPGISGDKYEERPAFIKLLGDIENDKVNCILTFRVDRISRDVPIGTTIAEVLKRKKCYVLSTEGCGLLDLNTPYGQQTYYTLINNSMTEVCIMSVRITSGKKQRAKNGLYLNSNSVYGYDSYYDLFNGQRLLKINDYESQNVAKMYEWFNNGISEYKISKMLNEQKVPCKRYGTWRQSTIHSILTNKLYIGKIIYRGKKKEEYCEYAGVHERIIDSVTFNKAQEIINKHKDSRLKKQPSKNAYLSSILICANCGSKMKSKQVNSKDKKSIRYYCEMKCGVKSVKHIQVEKLLGNYLESKINVELNEEDFNSFSDDKTLMEIRDKIVRYENKKDKVNNLFSEDCLELTEYKKQMKNLNEKIESLFIDEKDILNKKEKLSELDKEILKLNFTSFSSIWDELSYQNKQRLINSLVKKMYINIGTDKMEFTDIEFINLQKY